MRKLTFAQFMKERPYPDEGYIKTIWPAAKIDMTHAIKYYRIAALKVTVTRLASVLKMAWMTEGNTLNEPGPEVNLFEWVLHTAEVDMLFGIALELESAFKET